MDGLGRIDWMALKSWGLVLHNRAEDIGYMGLHTS